MLYILQFVTNSKKRAALVALSLAFLPLTAIASERLEQALQMEPPKVTGESEEIRLEERPKPEKTSLKWVCKGCTEVENRVLEALQERGIEDRVALSVIMGNIKQESKFNTTICEGGVRTGYHGCHRGGFGLIQWTTLGRYNGLGATARGLKLDPNSIEAQLAWMFREVEWKSVEHKFKTPGQSSSYYMNAAYRWLGWGVHGARSHYASQYQHFIHPA